MSSGTRSNRQYKRRWYRTKNFAQWLKLRGQGTVVSSIPLVLILFVTCLDFITFEFALYNFNGFFSLRSVAGFEDEPARLRADSLQKNVQAVAYIAAILLALPHLGALIKFFTREKGFLLIILVILLTSVVSENPVKVYTNSIHIGFGMIAAFLFAYPLRHQRDVIYKMLWVVFFLLLCGTRR